MKKLILPDAKLKSSLTSEAKAAWLIGADLGSHIVLKSIARLESQSLSNQSERMDFSCKSSLKISLNCLLLTNVPKQSLNPVLLMQEERNRSLWLTVGPAGSKSKLS